MWARPILACAAVSVLAGCATATPASPPVSGHQSSSSPVLADVGEPITHGVYFHEGRYLVGYLNTECVSYAATVGGGAHPVIRLDHSKPPLVCAAYAARPVVMYARTATWAPDTTVIDGYDGKPVTVTMAAPPAQP